MTDEMHEALTRHAARRGSSVAGLIRSLAGEWLEAQGEDVNWAIAWGGARRSDQPDVDATSEE